MIRQPANVIIMRFSLLLLILALYVPGLVLAQTTNSSGDWETHGNWDTGAAPSENIDNQIIT